MSRQALSEPNFEARARAEDAGQYIIDNDPYTLGMLVEEESDLPRDLSPEDYFALKALQNQVSPEEEYLLQHPYESRLERFGREHPTTTALLVPTTTGAVSLAEQTAEHALKVNHAQGGSLASIVKKKNES